MTAALATIGPPTFTLSDVARVNEGGAPEVLSCIHEPEIDLAIWRRSLASELVAWVEALPPNQLPDGRVLVGLNDLQDAVECIITESNTPIVEQTQLFVEDVVRLARLFSGLVGSSVVDLRLEAISHNSCWRFPRDAVRLRLLTTYRGPGTQIVATADSAEALKEQKDYRGRLCQLPAHTVALFKGNQVSIETGVVHRSPSIEGLGITRLLLCLNLPSAASPELWTG